MTHKMSFGRRIVSLEAGGYRALAIWSLTMIDMDCHVVRIGDNPWAALGDEVILLDMARDKYVRLNEVGTFVWERLQHPIRVADLCAALTRSFDVSPDMCAAELLAFLHRLETRRLLTVTEPVA